MHLRRDFTFLLAAALSVGCSAIINPDDNRLGGGVDAGPRADGGAVDGGPGRDAGPRLDAGPDFDAGEFFDAGPICPGGCDDSIACTSDTCVAGPRCAYEANDALCPSGQRCSPTIGCVPMRCTSNPECDDGIFCNGQEQCSDSTPGTGCVPGDRPSCEDPYACTDDSCDEATDRCVNEEDDTACRDGIDCTTDACDPDRADDGSGCVFVPNNAACNPDFCSVGSICDPTAGCTPSTRRSCLDGDLCTADSCNEATDMCDNVPRDEDMDGFPAAFFVGPGGPPIMCGGNDCNDGDPDIFPGATELCDGVDNNCDMAIDEGCPSLPDDCGSALPIVLDGAGMGSVSGRLGDFTPDYEPNPICMSALGARDAVYYFDILPGTWDVEIDTFGSAADTVLGLGFTCDLAGLATICNDDANPSVNLQSRIWLHNIQTAATIRAYVLVDGFRTSTVGDFVVNVAGRPALDDDCPGFIGGGNPLDITGGGTIVGTIGAGFGSERGSCQSIGTFRPEAIMQFHAVGGTSDFDAYSTDYVPDLHVRTSPCTSLFSEVACDIGASIGGGFSQASVSPSMTAGETHYVFVEGGPGSYALFYDP